MNISVFGLGYVGCVTAACLARDYHHVIGVDISEHKVNLLQSGRSPISEPGLGELLGSLIATKRLRATLDNEAAIRDSEITLICVGTPSNHSGQINLEFIINVCKEIGQSLRSKNRYLVVDLRSTDLPGTGAKT